MPPEDFHPDTGEVRNNPGVPEGGVMPPEGVDAEIPPSDDWMPDVGDGDEPSAAPEIDPPQIVASTLYGDVRDALLTRFQHTRKPWAQMSEQEQRETVEAFSQTARDVVRRSVQAVTGYDFPRAVVKLGAVQIKDKETIEAKITCANVEVNRSSLGDSVGEYVIVLMVDSEQFMAASKEPKIDKDQMGLDLDEGED